MASEDERHTTGHTTTEHESFTVVADEGVTYTAGGGDDTAGALVLVPRGDELQIKKAVATRWLNATPPKIVRVDEAKIGAAQRRLLIKLLERDEIAAGSPVKAWRHAARRWHGPSGRALAERRGLRWSVEAIVDGPMTPSVRSSVAQALRHLERRGLALRDAPAGSGRRTHFVQLSAAGRRVAKQLRDEQDQQT